MIDKETGKTKKAILRSYKISRLSTCDVPAMEGATAAILKRFEKFTGAAAMTNEMKGHQHLIQFYDYEGMTRNHGDTSWNVADDSKEDRGHSHPWVRDDKGKVTIGASDGHSHKVKALSKQALEKMQGDGVILDDDARYPILVKEDIPAALAALEHVKDEDKEQAVAHVSKRVADLEATDMLPEEGPLADLLSKGTERAGTADDLGSVEETEMSDKKKAAGDQAVEKRDQEALQAMEKRAVRAETIAGLSIPHLELYKTLEGDEAQEAFLALSPEGRDKEVAKAADANPVVYTAADGSEFRKSDDPRLVAMAKKADEDAAGREKLEKQLYNEQLQKRASELKNLPGKSETLVELLKAIDKMPEEHREKALEAMKAKNADFGKAFDRLGTSEEPDETADPVLAIAKGIREKDPDLTEEQAYVKALNTPEGQEAYENQLAKRRGRS